MKAESFTKLESRQDFFSESSLISSFTSSGRGRGNEEGNLLLGPTRGSEETEKNFPTLRGKAKKEAKK
jgi:hypothetical protein